MSRLLVQAGGGIYARLQPSGSGMITLEYGEVAGGAFYAAGQPRRLYAALCWNGSGWNLEAVVALVTHYRPKSARSRRLTVDLLLAREMARRDLQSYLQLERKRGADWWAIATLIKHEPEGVLAQFARNWTLPPIVRDAAATALATP